MDDALKHALGLLARRDYSVAELGGRLRSRYSEEEAEQALARLRSKRFLDDGRFAENFVASRMTRGPSRLLSDLKRRGIEEDVARTVLDSVSWPSLEEAMNNRMKRLRISPPLGPREIARLARYLDGLGFDPEEIRGHMERLA